ncbi:MAG: O-antigen ligase family protein [Candidatus Moranbacteria bacterium]|nr:O-antigen ligase family protein [Candidatus Moranbacteria bacterium]
MKLIQNFTQFLLFLIPFQFALNIGSTIDLAIIRVAIIALFLIYLTVALYKKNLIIPKGLIALFSFLFIFWTTFSIFYTPVLSWTLRKIIFLIFIGIIFLVFTNILNYAKKENKIDSLIKYLVAGSILVSLIGIIQFFSQFILGLNTILNLWTAIAPFFLGNSFSEAVIGYNSWLVNVAGVNLIRATAFFPDPHIFSFYCGLTAPFSLALFSKTKKYFWLLGFFTIILVDLLTFTRGGYFGLLVGFTVGIILFWSQLKTFHKHLATLFIILFILILFIPNNFFINRFQSSFDQSDNSVNLRLELLSEAWQTVQENLFVGVGLGAYPKVVNPQADYRMPIYAHNTYLDIWVELGLIGFLLFLILLFTLLIIFYKNREKTFPKFAIISLSIFMGHLIFDTPIFSVHIFPVFIFIVALGSFYENEISN